jgi:hypothetical protein
MGPQLGYYYPEIVETRASTHYLYKESCETRLWAVIQLRLRQDGVILGLQSAAIRRFAGEHFTSTEIDVLGPHIWKLLAAAQTGERTAAFEHHVTMRV